MPIVIDPRGVNSRGNKEIDESPDPLWNVYVREIQAMTSRLQEMANSGWNARHYELSESLCEASRAILYRIDFLTVDAAKQLQSLFLNAASAVDEAASCVEAEPKRPLLHGFADHLRRRAELLAERLASL